MGKNGYVWFERGRENENGDDIGATQHGVRCVKAVVRAQDGGGSEGQDMCLHSHQNGDEWGR